MRRPHARGHPDDALTARTSTYLSLPFSNTSSANDDGLCVCSILVARLARRRTLLGTQLPMQAICVPARRHWERQILHPRPPRSDGGRRTTDGSLPLGMSFAWLGPVSGGWGRRLPREAPNPPFAARNSCTPFAAQLSPPFASAHFWQGSPSNLPPVALTVTYARTAVRPFAAHDSRPSPADVRAESAPRPR